jgi:microcystin-dependent protein
MALKIGSTSIGSLYLGSTKIGQAYLGSTLVYSSSGPAPTPSIPAGIIEVFAGDTVPTGYLLCDGSAVDRTTYAALFAVIGTTYGAGDGSTTFNLPDMSGRVVLGVSGTHALASTGGTETVTLQTANLPVHSHSVPKHGHANTIAAKTPQLAHTITQPVFKYNSPKSSGNSSGTSKTTCKTTSTQTASRGTNLAVTAHAATACTMSGSVTNKAAFNSDSTSGGGSAHSNMQPYIAINYIISTGA